MAKQRVVDTKFWADGWVREKLNQLDRYLFLYFLTNEHTKISGLYELPLSSMAFETGFSRDELVDTMLPRLEPKVHYHEGWVIMPNFLKYQNLNNPKIQAGIALEIDKVPEEVKQKALAYGYPIDKLSHSNTNSNLNSNSNTNWFEEWWLLYPAAQRVDKQRCKLRYIAEINETEHKRRIKHLKEQIDKDRKWLGGYIPLTTTYTNQKRWDQEVEVEKKTKQTTTKIS